MNSGKGRSGDATMLLARIHHGDSAAADDLLPMVYDQLRAIAGSYFRQQRPSHTLQPTALVHEAYLKMIKVEGAWTSKAHFCAVAATAMRQILMNHARAKRAAKRSGEPGAYAELIQTPSGDSALDLVAVDDALTKLNGLDERSARLVELRFFGGLTMEEIGHVLDVSTSTVEKDWRRIRAWLNRELGNGAES